MNFNYSHHLPSELWDIIFTELAKFNLKNALICKIIRKNFNEVIEFNREINYSLLLIHSDKYHELPCHQLEWICTAGRSEIYVGYSKFPRIKVIEWCINRFNIDKFKIPFHLMCKKGYLTVIKWLVHTFNLTNRDIIRLQGAWCRGDNFFYAIICENGHTELLQYMLENFNLSPYKDTLSRNEIFEDMFYPACRNGRLNTAKWLVERFNLIEGENKIVEDCLFENICYRGRLYILKWLSEAFILNENIIKKSWYKILNNTYKNGESDVIRWLIITYYSSNNMSSIFRLACKYDDYYTVKWLIDTSRVTDKNVRANGNVSLTHACENRNFYIIDLIIEFLKKKRKDIYTERRIVVESLTDDSITRKRLLQTIRNGTIKDKSIGEEIQNFCRHF